MAVGRRAVLAAGAAVLVAGALGGEEWHDRRHAAGTGPAADPAESAALQAVLDRRAAAVRARDQAELAATVLPTAQALRDSGAAMLGNLAQVPVGAWEYRLKALDAYPLPPALGAGGAARLATRVELSYRLSGFDSEPVTATQYLTFTRSEGGGWDAVLLAP